MEEDETKKNERHRTLRQKKKARLEKREMLYTYVERHHACVLEEFEKFCCGDQPHINPNHYQPQPAPGPAPENTQDDSIDCIKDDRGFGGVVVRPLAFHL